jgi:hypothetical protein
MSRARSENTARARREHPWERARRLSFARWETEVRRTPYGRPLPDVVGFADAVEPPLHWSDPDVVRRLFALSALPAGSGSTYLAAVPAGKPRFTEGGLVRLSKPVKRVLPASDATYGELLIEARDGTAPAAWEEILEGVSPRAVTDLVPDLSELWGTPPTVTEDLLLPIVGTLPWHGRPAGLDLFLEVEGWSLARHRSFLSGLARLAPDWVVGARRPPSSDSRELELVSGAKVKRRHSVTRPFSIEVRPVSAPPSARPRDGSSPRSVITYGSALAAEFESVLASGQTVRLLNSENARRIPRVDIEIPDPVRAAAWGLHWWVPEPPDAPDWHRWLRVEEPRLRQALDTIPGSSANGLNSKRSAVMDRLEFRDRLAQSAFARARLRGATDVEPADLGRAVDSMVQAIAQAAAWAAEGRGPWMRVLDRTEGGRTKRLRNALEAILGNRAEGLTPVEGVALLRSQGFPAAAWDVESQLERLRIRGVLFQDRSGRYRVA